MVRNVCLHKYSNRPLKPQPQEGPRSGTDSGGWSLHSRCQSSWYHVIIRVYRFLEHLNFQSLRMNEVLGSKWASLVAQEERISMLSRSHRCIPWIRKIPWRRNGNPLQVSCLENPMDRGAWLATYSPWGCKESDVTERLHNNTLRKEVTICTSQRQHLMVSW